MKNGDDENENRMESIDIANMNFDVMKKDNSSVHSSENIKAKIEPEAETRIEAGQSKISRGLLKLRPIHFISITTVVAAAWISWPHVVSNDDLQESSLPKVALHTEKTNVIQVPQHYLAKEYSSISEDELINSISQEGDASNGVSPLIPPSINQEQVNELQSKIDELKLSLAALEMKSAQQCQTSKKVSTVTTIKKNFRKVNPGKSTKSRANETAVLAQKNKRQLSGFSLNTMYRDQAWIQNAEKIYVVQEGDEINDVKIIQIDLKNRQVITSEGFIR